MPVPLGKATIGVVAEGVVPLGNGEVDRGTKHVPVAPQVDTLKVPLAHVGTNPLCPVSTGGVVGFPLGAVAGVAAGVTAGVVPPPEPPPNQLWWPVFASAGAAANRADAPAATIPPPTATRAMVLKFA